MDRSELSENGSERAAADDEDLLWQKFRNPTKVEEFCGTWLALLCRRINGINAGIVLLGASKGGPPYTPVAVWPNKRFDSKHLAEAAERALTERRGLSIKRSGPDGSAPRHDIAYPLQITGQIYGIVALDADSRPQEALR